MCTPNDEDEPTSVEEALSSSARNEWMAAMKDELSSMEKNQVCELIDLPPGRKTIGNKWVLKVKRKADGSIDKYKARLVAKGYTQLRGVDYEDTFSPVVRFASIRLILAIVAQQDLELFHMDVKTAFLNGKLDEEIYMAQPEGFEVKGHERKVCHLKRSIYSLKQSSRQWYFRFHHAITSIETYIKKIIERFRMHNSKLIDTPMDKACTLTTDHCPKNDEEKNRMSKVPYAAAVGSLMYAMLCTRPDICYAVGLVSRYQSNPGPAHWNAVKRILRYLRGTTDLVLCYHGGDLRLRAYSDADWGADRDEHRSTSGGAISWYSKKKSCIALSTMESEYVACSATVQEAVWLRSFIQALGVTAHIDEAIAVHCENTAALDFVKDPKYHGKAKHIGLRYHFIRALVAQGEVSMKHIPTGRMVADHLTKPIARDVFLSHIRSMGLRRHYESDWAEKLSMYPWIMDDAVSRGMSRKAVGSNWNDMRALGRKFNITPCCARESSAAELEYMPIVSEKPTSELVKITEEMKSFKA
ncbi:hypothetical protein RJ640_024553 [Escallonia rubra]|uniref:Reverse transcriptase Ty1/copia-type domain-containing protein n=1 Tax=Escallonia rubra TaxID=112253 RepID=A0AA88US83_9ASTE|nr:hypothetical protein RJ640_024553 [Escallonia rubra]